MSNPIRARNRQTPQDSVAASGDHQTTRASRRSAWVMMPARWQEVRPRPRKEPDPPSTRSSLEPSSSCHRSERSMKTTGSPRSAVRRPARARSTRRCSRDVAGGHGEGLARRCRRRGQSSRPHREPPDEVEGWPRRRALQRDIGQSWVHVLRADRYGLRRCRRGGFLQANDDSHFIEEPLCRERERQTVRT
ncbi:MAG: hypothetical protein JWO36_63 [Myxococcales bacterium]|nr:hypothetical protein [Myxococcales bacterium]